MPFNKTIENNNSIETITYGKNEHHQAGVISVPLQDIIVNSINVGAGTVNATIGNVSAKDYPKQQIFDLINYGMHD